MQVCVTYILLQIKIKKVHCRILYAIVLKKSYPIPIRPVDRVLVHITFESYSLCIVEKYNFHKFVLHYEVSKLEIFDLFYLLKNFDNFVGGASAHMHLFSPLSRGLVHGAISLSGSAVNYWANRSI